MSARVACFLLVLSACALRPRYQDIAKDAEPPELVMQVVDRNNAPVPGARIELGDRARFKATTDENGMFKLPIDKKYTDENALVVVVLPKGVKGYKLVAKSPRAPEPPPDESIDANVDAGVTTM